jgi:hypothetical protein
MKMARRLQIDFNEKDYRQLEALEKRLDAQSKSALIRDDAIGLLGWFARAVLDNNRSIFEHDSKTGVTKEVKFAVIEQGRSANLPLVSEAPHRYKISSAETHIGHSTQCRHRSARGFPCCRTDKFCNVKLSQ